MANKDSWGRSGADKRYVRRDSAGRFQEIVDVGRSLAQDVRKREERVTRALEKANRDTGTFKPKNAR